MTTALKPHWTFSAFREGVIATLPLMPGLFAFGMAFGTVTTRMGDVFGYVKRAPLAMAAGSAFCDGSVRRRTMRSMNSSNWH